LKIGGDEERRYIFLTTIQTITILTIFFDIITPEQHAPAIRTPVSHYSDAPVSDTLSLPRSQQDGQTTYPGF